MLTVRCHDRATSQEPLTLTSTETKKHNDDDDDDEAQVTKTNIGAR